jgi:signal transduction histidine kinase
VGIVLENRRRRNFLQFNDLMEQKKLVDDLNQQKNKIISILSHDVAAPMNSLSTLLYLQSRGNITESELKTYLPKLNEQFNHVSVLLFSLVRWSKSQMDGFVLNKTRINLVELTERKIRLFHPQLIDKGLQLKLIADLPAYHIRADEEMIRIALRNLISNAIKFARHGTSIELKVSKSDQRKVLFSITNHGDHIPSTLTDKLFTFQMPSGLDTKGEKGTGIGLAMTAFFIRLNGGDIFLAPSDDGTTTFCIEMPEAVDQSVPV